MIEVKNLTKQYVDKKAVDNISFTVEDGEILGFLGPNGAGKSTTMNMLTGYISATSGQVLINGTDILEDPKKAKSQIGYLPELPPLYMDMTVEEYLTFVYELKNCKLPKSKHMKEICELVKISDVYKRLIKNLSKGYRQRVGLASALVNNPPILILDEPTVGLDPNQIIEIRTLIKSLAKKHTVILSSHILPEIQAVCDKIIIINKGRIAANDTETNISRAISKDHRLIARIEGPKDQVVAAIKQIKGVVSISGDMEREKGAYEYLIETLPDTDIRRELNKRIALMHWNIFGLSTAELTLEDIFMRITQGEGIEIPRIIADEEKTEAKEETKDQNNETSDGGEE